jgi:S-formylglutathione hydrolase FrmB
VTKQPPADGSSERNGEAQFRIRGCLASALLALAFALPGRPAAALEPGAVVLHTLPVAALQSNLLGDPAEIRVAIYLPPGYLSAPDRRYPSIYLLHGWLGSIDDFGVEEGKPGFQGMQLAQAMDAAIASGTIAEAIVVVPEGRNRYFGSFYTNSTVTGGWEDAIVRELVPWIDARYRTQPGADARGIAGFSMGGYGAIMLAMKHPDVFGAAYALSPCCLGLVGDLGPDNPWWANANRLQSRDEMRSNPASAEESFPIFVNSLAAAFSPNPARPGLLVDLPFADVDGQLRPSEPAWSAWRSHMPIYLLAQYQDNLRRLRGISLDVGARDEFAQIPAGARSFSQELASRAIPHAFEIYADGTHTSRIRERIETRMLPFFSRTLRGAQRLPASP